MTEKNIAVKVENLTKSFRIPLEASSGLKQKLINTLKGRKGYREFTPLKNLSFEIEEGEFFGIVGRNGSGKSTLLKTLAGIYSPDGGAVHVNGKLIPFIELGVGFNPELSGRENVFLNGALLGFSRSEMEAMYDEIVSFAELGDFMEERLKNYSSGMQVRLAFSIAIKAQGDVLLLDEVLAVGDEAFQRKCYSYFAQLKREKKTVILVTHSMEAVQQFCTKAALIDKEHELIVGTPAEVAQVYRDLNDSTEKDEEKSSSTKYIDLQASFHNSGEKLIFDFNISPKESIVDPAVIFVIYKDTGEWVYRWSSDEKLEEAIHLNGATNLHIEVDNIFPNGSFGTLVSLKSKDRTIKYADLKDPILFDIVNKGTHPGDIYWKPNESIQLEYDK